MTTALTDNNSNSSPYGKTTTESSKDPPTSLSNTITGLDDMPHHLLETMITNIGVSVAELSRKHVVLLVFLRYFGCVFCQRSIVDIVNSLSSLIKLNCIPVFVHQETVEEAEEFFSMGGMPKPLSKKQANLSNSSTEKETPSKDQITKRGELVNKFLRVADPEGNYYYQQFGVKSSDASDMSNNFKVVFETVKFSLTEGYKMTNHVAERASRTQLSASFVIANGKIVNRYLNEKVFTVPDFMEILLDVEGKGSDDLFDMLKDPSEYLSTTSTMNGADDNGSVGDGSVVQNIQQESSPPPPTEEGLEPLVRIIRAAKGIQPVYQPITKKKKAKSNTSCFSAPIEEASEKEITQQYPLMKILENKNQRKLLKLFSVKIYAQESLMFWEEAKYYQTVQNETKRKALAKKIVDSYLDPNSITEINIPSTVRDLVMNRYQSEGHVIHLFDELIKNVESDSLRDVYVRFLESDLFKERILQQK